MWKVKKVEKAKSNDYSNVDAYCKFYLPFFVVRLLILILQFMEGQFNFKGNSLGIISYKFSGFFSNPCNTLRRKMQFWGCLFFE